MNKSDQINEIALALSKAQSQIKGVMEDSVNPHFKNKYASLQSVIDACRDQLATNGLAVTHLLTDLSCYTMDFVTIETVLMHSSGQWISSTFSVPVSKKDAQGFGSAITYARRYSLMAAMNLAPIDDDGQAAAAAAPAKSEKLPASVVKAISQFKDKDELFAWAGQQPYKSHPHFRQLVQARKEELA
jgi:hypothetical protein